MDSCLRSIKPLNQAFNDFTSIRLNNSKNTIGRSLSNSIVIPSIGLSRSHCLISQMSDLSWAIKDTSSGEIRVNNAIIAKNLYHEITNYDIIQLDIIGDFTYIFNCNEAYAGGDVKQTCLKRKRSKRKAEAIFSSAIKKSNITQCTELDYDSEMLTDNSILNLKEEYESKADVKSSNNPQICLEVSEDMSKPTKTKIFPVKTEFDDIQPNAYNQKSREKILEDENKILTEKLRKQTVDFEKNLADALSAKHKKIESLKQKLFEGKLSMEKKMIKIENNHKYEIQNITNTMNMQLDDMKKHVQMSQDEINELNLKIYNNTLATEKEKQLFLEELKQKEVKLKQENDNAISEYILRNAALELEKKNIERSLTCERTNFQNVLNAKEVERKDLLNALLVKTTQAEKSLKILKRKMKLHGLTDKHKRLSKNNAASSSKVVVPAAVSHECAVMDEYNNLLETELRCSICTEIFIKPVTLNCGHTFCRHCLNLCKKTKNLCPVCRAKIKSDSQNITLDSLIVTIVSKLDDETRRSRIEIIKERDDIETAQVASVKVRQRSSTPADFHQITTDESLDSFGSTSDNDDVVYYSFGYRRYNYYQSSESGDASDDDDE